MRMSISTTSGRGRARPARAPRARRRPRRRPRGRARRRGSCAKPARTSAWSSTTTMRTVTAPCGPATRDRRQRRRRAAAAARRTAKPPPARGPASTRAAVERDPLAHADQAVAGPSPAASAAAPRPSSMTSICSSAGSTHDRHRGAGRPGVLERVGQRLLHDPVGGQVDAGGSWSRSPCTVELDVEAGVGPRPSRRGARSTERRAAGASSGRGAAGRSAPARRRAARRAAGASRPGPRGRCSRRGVRASIASVGSGGSSTRRAAAGLHDHHLMAWATTSCSSRAMRVRSSATARWASAARVLLGPDGPFLRRRRRCWRRWRTFSPKTHGTTSSAPLNSAVRARRRDVVRPGGGHEVRRRP